jgi:hypothetical protein
MSEDESYMPIYAWRRTKLDTQDVPTDNDWLGFDGDREIGRVRKELNGPMQGFWQWSGSGGRTRNRLLPHSGYEPESQEAMRRVENYYHALMARNGMKGSKQ